MAAGKSHKEPRLNSTIQTYVRELFVAGSSVVI